MAQLTGPGSVRVGYNALQYIASYDDLISALGDNPQAGVQHYDTYGYGESRQQTFSGLSYIATYADLIAAYGADGEAGGKHYIDYGRTEGRATAAFDGLVYIASYQDLIAAFGADSEAGARHYIQYGHAEGRATAAFDGLQYIASYGDLIAAYGANVDAGAAHYIKYGYAEGRATTFKAYEYLASYSDLTAAFGDNADAAAQHYIQYGVTEHRIVAFDAQAYLDANPDVRAAYGNDLEAAARHYIDYGRAEGRQPFFLPSPFAADAPKLSVSAASGAEDSAIPLAISAALKDAGEVLSVVVSGVPSGATLSAGHDNGDGSWTLSPGDLASLSFNPAANVAGAYALNVAAISFDAASGTSATTTASLPITVQPVSDTPLLSVVPNATGDRIIPLSLAASLTDTDGSETLNVTISGVPSGATLSAGHDNGDGSWTLAGSDLAGLTLAPAAGASGSFTLSATAIATDGTATPASSAPAIITVAIAPASDAPTLSVSSTGGTAGQVIPLSISVGLTDADSETLGDVLVYGVPSAFTLNHGLLNDEGAWVVPVDQLSGLALIASDLSVFGALNLRVVASSTENGTSTPALTTKILAFDIAAPAGILNGQIIDGYVAGATVFADHNRDGVLDNGEVSTTTRADGTFSLSGADPTDPLVMFGGTDISTGLGFAGKLTAVGGSTVITPLTTLVQTLVATGSDAAAAEAAVKTAFGLSQDVALSTFDPIAATASGSAAGAAVLAAGVQVQTTVAQLAAAGVAQADVVSTLAGFANAGGSVNLADPGQVATIASASGVASDKIDTIKAVTAAANGSIASAVASGSGLDILSGVSQAANVALGSTTTAIATTNFSDPAAKQSLQDNSTGAALDNKVDAAPVGVVTQPFIGTIGADTIDQHTATAALAIDGREGNDVLIGGAGGDKIFGGAGNDQLTGNGGGNQLDGGSGLDRAIYSDASGPVSANLLAGTIAAPGIADTIISIEAVRGSAFNDTYDATGYTAATHLSAGQAVNEQGSFNEFEGLGGDDTVTGNGNTRVSYQSALAGVSANLGAGAQSLSGETAGVGHDTFVGGINAVRGSQFGDVLTGTSTTDPRVSEFFEGLGGDDTIDGAGGFDRARYDNFSPGSTGIKVDMGAGIVTGRDAAATAVIGTDTLHGVEGVIGSSSDDVYDASAYTATSTLSAGQVNDQGSFNDFEGLGGNDTIIGNGNTRVSYIRANAGVTVDIAAGTARGTADGDLAGVGTDTFTGVSYARGTQYADILRGSNQGNAVTEQFDGRGGDDFIDGRGNFDRARYDADPVGAVGITVKLAAGTVTSTDATTLAVVGNDTFRSVESFVGTYSADTFDATGYTNTSNLSAGQVTNDQGDFNEFEGMGGNDTVIGNGQTRISYQRAQDGVTVTLSAAGTGTSTGTAAGDIAVVGNDTFSGVGFVRGSNFADHFIGSSAGDNFEGYAGNDLIEGGGGIDSARYDVTPTGTFGAVGIQVNLAAGTVTSSDATTLAATGTDTLRSIEIIRGTSSADTFDATGFSGSSTNAGSNGAANTFDGRGGNDTIIGNGQTTAVYNNSNSGVTVDYASNTVYSTAANDAAGIGVDTFSGIGSFNLSNFDDLVVFTGSNGSFLGNNGADTVTLAGAGPSHAYALFLASIETVNVSTNNVAETVVLNNPMMGPTAIDLGTGTDTVTLGSAGTSTIWSLGLANVETLNTSAGNTDGQTVILTKAVGGLTVNLGAGTDTLNLYGPDATVSNSLTVANVETVNGGNGNNTINFDNSGGGTGQIFNLGPGHNVLNLAGSNGTFAFAYNGTDVTLNGRAGNDDVTITNTVYNKVIDLGAGSDALHLTSQFNTLTVKNVETVYGSTFSDQVTIGSSASPTTVIGGGGADQVTASSGEDHFRFNAFTDSTLNGQSGPGSDTISGYQAGTGAGHDFLDFSTAIPFAGAAIDYLGLLQGGITSPSASGHAQAFLTQGGSVLQIDVNNDGVIESGHDMQILLNNVQGTLAQSDFHLV